MVKILILYHDVILYHNDQITHLNMIIEVLTIGAIMTSCSLLTWFAMKKYQPKIEARLDEIETSSTGLKITEKRHK